MNVFRSGTEPHRGCARMSVLDRLETRVCPVCAGGPARASVFLEASLDPSKLTAASFASRKTPEFMSYRLLRCLSCETVYAAAAPPAAMLAHAYAEADYDSSEEAGLAADTYATALASVIAALPQRGRVLEVGTGSGVLLERLLDAGFSEAVGIEPSAAAIAAAAPAVRGLIREGVFVEADFEPASFDLICCFQTLEHVPDPRALVQSCARLLRPGGVLALVTHDYAAPINRLLGRRSPIVDIEHLQLFCRPSLGRLLHDAGLPALEIRVLTNRYPLRYWLRLTPLPDGLKHTVAGLFEFVSLDRVRFGINVGNLLATGRKPTIRMGDLR
jgi:SAM-dependent methyltransferase